VKINPVYQQESRISARSFRLPLIILLCNSILALVALLDMYESLSQRRHLHSQRNIRRDRQGIMRGMRKMREGMSGKCHCIGGV